MSFSEELFKHCLSDNFANCGVREYELLDISNSHLSLNHHSRTVDDLGRVATDHMKTDNVVMLVVCDYLEYAVAVLVLCDVSSAVLESKSLNGCVEPLLLTVSVVSPTDATSGFV